MSRQRKGFIVERDGKIYVRVQFTDSTTGKRREIMRTAETRTKAEKLRAKLLRELEEHGETLLEGDSITFEQLADEYQSRKLVPAKIVEGKKVAGLKGLQTALGEMKSLRKYFGKKRIKTITHGDVEDFKLNRLDTPTMHGEQRGIATVNRELERLRAIFNFAKRRGWLSKSPYEMGDPLISRAVEIQRNRVLSYEEEKRLLDACVGSRAHLRPIIICALDTGMRRGEIFKLKWNDVDWTTRTITVIAGNSKTEQERLVGITDRLRDELKRLWEESPKDADRLVFGITTTIKTAWKSAMKDAVIENFRFHDARHTAITRMVRTGAASAIVMRVSGHTQHTTFRRYVNPDEKTIASLASSLGKLNETASSGDI